MSNKPCVLFVCIHNAGRSHLSAGFARALGGHAIEVRSASSAPAEQLNAVAVQAMAEVGIDISAEVPTLLTVQAVASSDVVITMGCGDACPIFPGIDYLDWALPDLAGKTVEFVRPIRDEIRNRVERLLADLLAG